MKYHPSALRKYISEHNRRIRKDIGEEIKSERVKYSKFLKVKRADLKKEQTINTKGLKKEGLVNAILKSPVIMRAIKADKGRNKPFFEGFEFKENALQPIKKQADKKKDIAKQPPVKSNLKTVTKEDIKELGKGKKKRRIKVEEEDEKPDTSKIEKQMKRNTIIGKVRALGQKQVIKKKQLASKIEKTAEKLKKERVKKPDISKILKDNNLKFTRYNKPVQLVYDRDSNKTDEKVIEATLVKDKKSILVRTKGASGIRVTTLDVSPVGSKIKVKTKAEKEAQKKAEDERQRKIRKPAKQPPKKPKVINDSYSKIIKDFPSVVSIKKQPNSQGVEILTKRGANLKMKESNEIFRRVRDILTDKGEPFQLGMSEEKEKAPAPKPKPAPAKKAPTAEEIKAAAIKAAEETDSEDEEVEPPISKVPKKLHKVWIEYMEEKVGDYYTKSNQQTELDELKEGQKEYFEAKKRLREGMNLTAKEPPNKERLC